VTREDFRREIGDAFDSISGSPDPALPERVRAGLQEAPEQRGPVWAAALAAAVIAVILVGVLLVGNPLNRGPLVPGGAVHPTPTCCPSYPTPAPTPSASPFVCVTGPTTLTNEVAPPLAFIDAVRTGTHPGYDRLTIEFKDATTGTIQITPQANTKFVMDASGKPVTLAGKYGLLIKIDGADNHTAYTGPTDFKTPNYPGILEVREIGDYEGKVQWAVGLSATACYQATMLTSPTRLVVDIQTS
jgi:hypothetical protein